MHEINTRKQTVVDVIADKYVISSAIVDSLCEMKDTICTIDENRKAMMRIFHPGTAADKIIYDFSTPQVMHFVTWENEKMGLVDIVYAETKKFTVYGDHGNKLSMKWKQTQLAEQVPSHPHIQVVVTQSFDEDTIDFFANYGLAGFTSEVEYLTRLNGAVPLTVRERAETDSFPFLGLFQWVKEQM